MSRNVLQTMASIEEVTKSYVDAEDICRITNVRRHIQAAGDEEPVCDFVKHAKYKCFIRNGISIFIFFYNDQKLLFLPRVFCDPIDKIGYVLSDNIAITQGATMLAISSKNLPISDNVTSLRIIEEYLGLDDSVDGENVIIPFSSIAELFKPYLLYIIDDSRFQIAFEEDINRLSCFLLSHVEASLSTETYSAIQQLSLLLSSRSIAGSILNGFQSSLIDYAFLQFYQCIEYLFQLNLCFIISEDHSIPIETAIHIVLAHEFKLSESEHLYRVLKDNAPLQAIEDLLSKNNVSQEEIKDKYRTASTFIYRLRCNIAHLRYNQEELLVSDWRQCIESLVNIITSIYTKRDTNITHICISNNSWKRIDI